MIEGQSWFNDVISGPDALQMGALMSEALSARSCAAGCRYQAPPADDAAAHLLRFL